MRVIAALCLAVLIAGCASSSMPLPRLARDPGAPGANFVTPALGATELVAADGTRLPLASWLPEGEPRAVVLALHGFNDYSNAFATPAAAWAKDGIATFAYDQRGFGRAPGRGLWPGEPALVGDVATAARLLRQRYPGVPLYLLGESMGGAIAILAASGRGDAPKPDIAKPDVDGVILVAPAVWGRQSMTLVERVGLWFAGFMPSVHFSADILPVRIWPSDNMAMLRAYSRDPLVIKDTRADAINGLVDLMSAALNAGPWLDAPCLLLYGEHDEIVPRDPVAHFVASLPARAHGRQRVALYAKGYHMLLRDLGGALPTGDIGAWIESGNGVAALPSGADRGARGKLTGEGEPIAALMR
jgi:acylglycerol lipase